MRIRHLALLTLSALALSGAVVAQSGGGDPHGHAGALRASLGVDPMSAVYIVTSQATFDGGVNALVSEAAAQRDGAGRAVVVGKIRAHQLDELSRFIHERERRCGGYFAFATRKQAVQFLREDRTVRAMQRKALPTYTIDNAATVAPWLPLVRESRISDTITHLSTAYRNRYYANTTGQQASQWLKSTWVGLGHNRPDVSVGYVTCTGCGKQPSVVMTVLGSSRPDEIVVVGAHLDSISDSYINGEMNAPGADDDASGVATVTEVIRVALAKGWKPQRTVKFMAYAAEEVGLRGSHAIADEHQDDHANVVGVLQLDMTNYTAGSTVSMELVSDYTNTGLNEFVRKLFDRYLAPLGLTRGVYTCGYACSDHASWTAAGYPSAFMVEPTLFPYLHTPNDTLANSGPTSASSVNFAKLALAFIGELGKTTHEAPVDFNADGRSDVFWRNLSTGANDIWRSANVLTRTPTNSVTAMAWQAVGIDDLDGDGREDVLWRNASTGANDLWKSASAATRVPLGTLADTGWRVAGLGDFGMRGAADIFWRHATTGQIQVWVGGNSAVVEPRATVASADWQVVGVGDFDGDLHDDVLWRNRVTGSNEMWRWGTSERRLAMTAVTNTAWIVGGVGDLNGDGSDDIIWRNTSTGANVAWLSGRAATQMGMSTIADLNWKLAAVGDYDGDGRADVFWRHALTGQNELWPAGQSSLRQVLARVADVNWTIVR
ncbi:M20/M25/M40 family metallo-hydrolase [Agrilutibacter solisilvae]|uniref:M20/M25/M40 family metallo-hydrolase n=1 Tax=Agrilutibacter solisilvae TaxID=2763317 RepID=A0A974XWD6_9GAMM|nr:M20/M25/M40 family metallo-hydrolase [Lysobacter solisilvae]QSX77099.1 M20/M25/M40 family metallo-hydrolase [Lysobacter solisilvae]